MRKGVHAEQGGYNEDRDVATGGAMTSIGIRELRDGLSKHIAAVAEGATITVTDHGRPVARISPIDAPTQLERLVAEGVITLPNRPKRPAPEPVAADVALSEIVIANRR
jgi:prevent-host-death family protein